MSQEQSETPAVDPNAVHTPRALAGMFPGVSVEMLRSWENLGKIPAAIKTLGGHRRYTEEHVAKIAQFMGQPKR